MQLPVTRALSAIIIPKRPASTRFGQASADINKSRAESVFSLTDQATRNAIFREWFRESKENLALFSRSNFFQLPRLRHSPMDGTFRLAKSMKAPPSGANEENETRLLLARTNFKPRKFEWN